VSCNTPHRNRKRRKNRILAAQGEEQRPTTGRRQASFFQQVFLTALFLLPAHLWTMESGSGDAFSEFTDYSLFYVLPNEIVISIFRKLPIHELSCTIPSVCKQWFFISTDNLLWRELYGQKWQTIPHSLRKQLNLSPRGRGRSSLASRYACSFLAFFKFIFVFVFLARDYRLLILTPVPTPG